MQPHASRAGLHSFLRAARGTSGCSREQARRAPPQRERDYLPSPGDKLPTWGLSSLMTLFDGDAAPLVALRMAPVLQ